MSQSIDLDAGAHGVAAQRRQRLRPKPLAAGDRPTVSVVIPCFNYARFLPDAIGSALTQERVTVDVVVVDDCSTDDSLAVARAIAAQEPAVTVVAHERNQGPVVTFNDGLQHVTGEFVVRLDADDMLTPGSLARATALARQHPNVGLVYGHPCQFTGEPPEPRRRTRSWTVWPGRHWLADACRTGLNVIASPEVLMRTALVEQVGGQQPLAHTHDMEMWLRMAAFADVGRVNGPDQAWHREHAGSLSARSVDKLMDLRERQAAFDLLFAGAAGAIPEAEQLHQLARRAIARSALDMACYLYDRAKVDEEQVAALVEIAREAAPADTLAKDWRRLQRRMILGPDRVQRRPWSVASVIRGRVQHAVNVRLWSRTGIYGRSLGARSLRNG